MASQPALEQYQRQRQRALSAVLLARREWATMGEDFDAGWARVGPRLALLVASAQLGAAEDGARYVGTALAAADQTVSPLALVKPRAFAGISSGGQSLDGLLYGSVVHARQADVSSLAERLDVGGRHLDALVQGQVADAGRDASSAAVTARPRVSWVRVVNPPCCQRCAVLAGRVYRYSQSFQRHPRCFPAGVVVSGPRFDAATRRPYEGELVILSTAGGQDLTITGNHPVLTGRGWVPANRLREGDDVVRSTRPQGAAALVVPNHDEVPSRIEDVWGSLSVAGLDSVESTPEDFHGDGQYGQVDVVWANRPLDAGPLTSLFKHVPESLLTLASRPAAALYGQGSAQGLDLGYATHSGRSMGGLGLRRSLTLGHQGVALQAGLAHPSDWDASLSQSLPDRSTGYAVLGAESVLAGTVEVLLDNNLRGQLDPSPRWDAADAALSVEDRTRNASRGSDLLKRLAGQVELDRVVEVRRVGWSGHVYSLNSSEGWHSANSLIVSNCDCTMLPQTVANPDAVGIRIGAEDVKDLTRKQRAAIDDGADFNKTINDYQRKRGDYLPPTRVDRITAQAANRTAAVDALTRAGYLAA